MAVTGPGRKPSQDWALLLAQFEADYVPQNVTLKEFCEERSISEKIASAAFIRERKRSALAAFHDRNRPLLLVAQRGVMSSLAQVLDKNREGYDPRSAGEFALKVYEKVAEREEPNPGLTQQLNVIIPPMFPESALAAKAIEAITGISRTVEAKRIK